jgi:hypothetical protein
VAGFTNVAGFNVWPGPGRPGRPELLFLSFAESVVHRFLNVPCDLVAQDLYVKTCASRLGVKKRSMKNRRHESATSVPLELGGILVLCHLLGQSRVQSLLELIGIHGGLRVDAKNAVSALDTGDLS